LKIIKGKIIENWWRDTGHLLQLKDIQDVVEAEPGILIIGTGASGLLRLADGLISNLENRGMTVYVQASASAVEKFNQLVSRKGEDELALAIHLTC